jgi:Protein of unknown function (DUF2510)
LTQGEAGWFADPVGLHQLRYYSGGQWTEHVADNGIAGVDPLVSARTTTLASRVAVSESGPPSNASSHTLRSASRRWPISRLRMAAAAVVVLLGAVGAVFIVRQPTSQAVSHSVTASKVLKIGNARSALLVLSDMPRGWTSTKSTNNNSAIPGAAQLASCIGVPTSVITDNPPGASSPDFNSKNEQLMVDDNVSIYPSARAAQADFSSLANAKTPSCLTAALNGPAKSALETGFGPGTSIGTVTVTRTPAADYARDSANFTMFVPISGNGSTLNLEITVVDFVRGRDEQTVTLSSVDTQFPISLARRLTTIAVDRL